MRGRRARTAPRPRSVRRYTTSIVDGGLVAML